MFDKLSAAESRFEEISNLVMTPEVINDNERYRKLMKEYRDLEPIVEKYREYAKAKEASEEARLMLDEGGLDKDFKELAEEEYLTNKEKMNACA